MTRALNTRPEARGRSVIKPHLRPMGTFNQGTESLRQVEPLFMPGTVWI